MGASWYLTLNAKTWCNICACVGVSKSTSTKWNQSYVVYIIYGWYCCIVVCSMLSYLLATLQDRIELLMLSQLSIIVGTIGIQLGIWFYLYRIMQSVTEIELDLQTPRQLCDPPRPPFTAVQDNGKMTGNQTSSGAANTGPYFHQAPNSTYCSKVRLYMHKALIEQLQTYKWFVGLITFALFCIILVQIRFLWVVSQLDRSMSFVVSLPSSHHQLWTIASILVAIGLNALTAQAWIHACCV